MTDKREIQSTPAKTEAEKTSSLDKSPEARKAADEALADEALQDVAGGKGSHLDDEFHLRP